MYQTINFEIATLLFDNRVFVRLKIQSHNISVLKITEFGLKGVLLLFLQ